MRQFEICCTLFGSDITAHVLQLDKGIHVSVFGGDLTHIGAVSAIAPNGDITMHQFPGHRDGVISERWAKALADFGYRPTTVTAGIHYDGLSREGIQAVLAASEQLLDEVLSILAESEQK